MMSGPFDLRNTIFDLRFFDRKDRLNTEQGRKEEGKTEYEYRTLNTEPVCNRQARKDEGRRIV